MQLAKRIRAIRENSGLSQADVAYELNISPQAYSKIERQADRARLETLRKLADILSVSVVFLVDVDNPHVDEGKNNF
jgi:transcriptional regulator with XRE-family HTH domain